MPGVLVSIQPTFEPVPLEYFKAHSRVSHPLEDALLAGYIIAAREYAESYTGRAFAPRTCVAAFDGFPADDWLLPVSPVTSITSITYVDTDGVVQTVPSGDYVLDLYGLQSKITRAYNAVWPVPRTQSNAVLVTFVTGTAEAMISDGVRVAICMLAAHYAENREGGAPIPEAVRNTLTPHVLTWM